MDALPGDEALSGTGDALHWPDTAPRVRDEIPDYCICDLKIFSVAACCR